MQRSSGVLLHLHPTSLPSTFGIGDLGKDAYDSIDFLRATGQKYWQILPLEPTGYGNSPPIIFEFPYFQTSSKLSIIHDAVRSYLATPLFTLSPTV